MQKSSNKHSKDIILSALIVVRKNSREEEIRLYNKPLCFANVYRNKKKYTRKYKHKKDMYAKQFNI